MVLVGFPHRVLVESGGHNGDRSASGGGVRLDGLVGKAGYPRPLSSFWLETLAATLAPLSRHLSFAGL